MVSMVLVTITSSFMPNPTKSLILLYDQLSNYIQTIFPEVFQSKPWIVRMVAELQKYHRYVSFITDTEWSYKRVVAGIRLFTVQSMLMFLLALLYDLQAPDDDGSCVQYTTLSACWERKSFLDLIVPGQRAVRVYYLFHNITSE